MSCRRTARPPTGPRSSERFPESRSGTIALLETSRLAAFPLFADLPASELDELAAAVRAVEYDAGFPVVKAEDYGTAVYFVEYGEVEVTAERRGRRSHARGGATCSGRSRLLLTGQRTATVTTRTPVRLLALSGLDFERIRPRVPELERSLRRVGAERASL